MAKFKITPTTTVAELKEQFRNEVGCVLRVYQGRSEAPDVATLVSLGAKEGEVECRTSRTVGKFEEAFQNELNLKVKVYTKDNWVKVLDGITLAVAGQLPNGMTKAKMEEHLSYKRDEEETAEVVNEETTESVEVPEEYKGLPIVEIMTEEIDPYIQENDKFKEVPTFGIVFYGYSDEDKSAAVLVDYDHKHLCQQSLRLLLTTLAEYDETKVFETSLIRGYGKADDVEEIKGVIGMALNEYYAAGSKHLYEYDWESWFPEEAIFVVDDDVFVAYKDGGIELIDLTDSQIKRLKEYYSDNVSSSDSCTLENFGKVSDDILNSIDDYEFEEVGGVKEVEINGKWGFIDKCGNILIAPKFDEVVNCFVLNNTSQVEVNGKWGIIDEKGNIIIDPKFEQLGFQHREGLMRAKINGKWGYVDQNYNFIIEPKFDSADDFVFGIAKVCINGKYGYIDKTGNFAIEPKFEQFGYNFSDGVNKAQINGKWGIIDEKGNFVLEPKFDNIEGSLINGLIGVETNGKWGFVDESGNFVIVPKFDEVIVGFNKDGIARVELNGERFKIDKKGNRVKD